MLILNNFLKLLRSTNMPQHCRVQVNT